MKHRTMEEIADLAQIAPVDQKRNKRWIRRQRLRRLATLIEEYNGPVRLFSMMEYVPARKWGTMRQDDSPLTVAFQDLEFRRQGLKSDCVGEAIVFFDISKREAHHLLCDCHYLASIAPDAIARRARSLAEKKTFGERWQGLRQQLWG
jgi:hypothetical protein